MIFKVPSSIRHCIILWTLFFNSKRSGENTELDGEPSRFVNFLGLYSSRFPRLGKMCSHGLWSIKMDLTCVYAPTENTTWSNVICKPEYSLCMLSACSWALLSSGCYASVFGEGPTASYQNAGFLNICGFPSPFISQKSPKTLPIQSSFLASFITSLRWMEHLTQALIKDSSHRSLYLN